VLVPLLFLSLVGLLGQLPDGLVHVTSALPELLLVENLVLEPHSSQLSEFPFQVGDLLLRSNEDLDPERLAERFPRVSDELVNARVLPVKARSSHWEGDLELFSRGNRPWEVHTLHSAHLVPFLESELESLRPSLGGFVSDGPSLEELLIGCHYGSIWEGIGHEPRSAVLEGLLLEMFLPLFELFLLLFRTSSRISSGAWCSNLRSAS